MLAVVVCRAEGGEGEHAKKHEQAAQIFARTPTQKRAPYEARVQQTEFQWSTAGCTMGKSTTTSSKGKAVKMPSAIDTSSNTGSFAEKRKVRPAA